VSDKTPSLDSNSTVDSADAVGVASRPNSFEMPEPEPRLRRRSMLRSLRRREAGQEPVTYQDMVERESVKIYGQDNAPSRRNSLITDLKRMSRLSSMRPSSEPPMEAVGNWDAEWDAMNALMTGEKKLDDSAWEQYADLGGFRQLG
jgi:hypothetical protein